MGFVFRAGPASYVFPESLASEVCEALERRFGFISDNQYSKLETFLSTLSPPGLVRKPADKVFCSKELPAGAWEELQQAVRAKLNPSEISHLLAVPAGNGAYIPGLAGPETVRISGTDLRVAGVEALLKELLIYSSIAKLPVEQLDLRALEKSVSDYPASTYIQLMLGVQFALAAGCGLWLID